MRRSISYFDPRCPELEVVDGRNMTVITNTQEEYDATMAVLNDPERGITNIIEEDLPPLSTDEKYTPQERLDFLEEWMDQIGYVPNSEVEDE